MIKLNNFQKNFLKNLNFKEMDKGFCTMFSDESNKDSGFLLFANRPGCYTLIFGDYTIPKDFALDFSTDGCEMRFGLVHDGVSQYEVNNKRTNKFMPAPFIAVEDHLFSGHQKWTKGSHYEGIELFINIEYLKNKIAPVFPQVEGILDFPKNRAILYLPIGVTDVLNFLKKHMLDFTLDPLMLEAKVLECISLITTELLDSDLDFFFDPVSSIDINISSDRSLQLSSEDITAIHNAQMLIAENLSNPPTIGELCRTLYINEQKLAMGFRNIYNSTIGNYIKDLRLSTGANLLSSTDLSIEEISAKVGYSHSSNFSKAFKSKYKRTPLQFRKFRSREFN